MCGGVESRHAVVGAGQVQPPETPDEQRVIPNRQQE